MYRYSRELVHGDSRAARHLYFEKGRQIAESVEQIARAGFGGLGEVPSLLDFASGYGRSTRFLAASLDPGRVTVCEIQESAAAFLRTTFGVDSIDAATKPEHLRSERRFAMITAASFFTHCPPARFTAWLERLAGLLETDGVLMFSVNDFAEAPAEAARREPGVAFSPSSESEVLGPDDYGTTWVSEEYVMDALRGTVGGSVAIEWAPRGLCAHQDLWIVRRGTAAAAPLAYERHPAGHVEEVATHGDEVHLAGWAEDLDRVGGIEDVLVCVEGEPGSSIAPSPPDSSGRQSWSCGLPLQAIGLDDLIVVDAVAASGRSSLLGVGSLRPFVQG